MQILSKNIGDLHFFGEKFFRRCRLFSARFPTLIHGVEYLKGRNIENYTHVARYVGCNETFMAHYQRLQVGTYRAQCSRTTYLYQKSITKCCIFVEFLQKRTRHKTNNNRLLSRRFRIENMYSSDFLLRACDHFWKEILQVFDDENDDENDDEEWWQ